MCRHLRFVGKLSTGGLRLSERFDSNSLGSFVVRMDEGRENAHYSAIPALRN